MIETTILIVTGGFALLMMTGIAATLGVFLNTRQTSDEKIDEKQHRQRLRHNVEDFFYINGEGPSTHFPFEYK